MENIRLHPECISCLVKKQIGRYPDNVSENTKIKYMQSVLKIIADAPKTMSAPEVVADIYELQREMFNDEKDYTEIKRYFNNLMLELEEDIRIAVDKSSDPLKTAIQYSMTENYIDFAAMDKVDENELKRLLKQSHENRIDESVLEMLKDDIAASRELVFLTDNCGEIVLDKIMISVIKQMNPNIKVTAIVRGYPVINDATMEDAEQVGLDALAQVIGNGSKIAGNCLDRISYEARYAIDNADMIISKGQANFETLNDCGKNIYYIFMCKCSMFAKRFDVPMHTGMVISENLIWEKKEQ